VREKIADLKRMERALKQAVAQCGEGASPCCPLIESLFREADSSCGIAASR
jgi:MerR family mercuric resistance operon transcriptional regulator